MSQDRPSGHDIPGPAPQEPPVAYVPAPSVAERARTVVAAAKRGALATQAVEPGGYPYASAVNVAVGDDGAPLTFLSTMAEHTRNLARDPRASILLAEPGRHGADLLALGRVTLIGDLLPHDTPGGREAFLSAHPSAFYVGYGDFSAYRLDVRAVRWVGGFGRMSWVDPAAYAAAEPDPLREVAPGALAHLNDDHPDALLACARGLARLPDATAARVIALDRYGLDLEVEVPAGRLAARVTFTEPLTDAATLRAAAVALTRRARAALDSSDEKK
jgi:putative heme iron utilization protein